MREAYSKAGLPPEDMDWEAMGMDIKTCGRELAIRPAKCASPPPPRPRGPPRPRDARRCRVLC